LIKLAKILVLNPKECSGCRTCEVVCSLVHVGTCNPARSGINIWEKDSIDVPIFCLQCEEPRAYCQDICPLNAISRNQDTGALIIDKSKCTGCSLCVGACPYKAISIDPVQKVAVKCDLCKGDAACVRFCPEGALEYIEPDEARKKTTRQIMGIVSLSNKEVSR